MTTTALPPQSDEIIAAAAGGGQDFAPPPTGPFSAVCCDVIDLGIWEQEWKGKKKKSHKVRVVFQIPEKRQDGKRFEIGRMFTLSLGDKANLRKFLESWRGIPFTADQLAGFNLVTLIGAPAFIQVKHTQRGDRTYGDIDTIMRLPKEMPRLLVEDYVRVKDRDKSPEEIKIEEEADDLPF